MKTHTKWIAVYIIIVIFMTVLTVIGIEHGNTSESVTIQMAYLWEPETNFEPAIDYAEETIRMEDLDYLTRMDLGYPRIGRILDSQGAIIKRYANRYGFDWRLILAVMNQESRFRAQAVSHRGAYGLMQIMPMTGQEVSSALGIDGVALPEDNIAGGVYYLWRLHTMFDQGDVKSTDDTMREFDRLRLALAAYNGGPTRIRDAQRLAEYLNLDPNSWEVIRALLPMLSRRYASLHRYVWEQGRPQGGYFEGYEETLNYVDRTVEYYAYYRQMFE
jgi:membrane-bound lytic murein transglycosylase MltF